MNNDNLKSHAVRCATAYLALLYEERNQPAVALAQELRALRIFDKPLREEYLHAFLDTLAAQLDGDDPFIIAGKFADQPDEYVEAQVYFHSGTHSGHAATVHTHRPADRQTATLDVACVCGVYSSDLDKRCTDREFARLARSARHLAPIR